MSRRRHTEMGVERWASIKACPPDALSKKFATEDEEYYQEPTDDDELKAEDLYKDEDGQWCCKP